jgi:hypothetical protein
MEQLYQIPNIAKGEFQCPFFPILSRGLPPLSWKFIISLQHICLSFEHQKIECRDRIRIRQGLYGRINFHPAS